MIASTSCAAATGNYFAPTAAVVCGKGVECATITEARIGQFLTQVVQNPTTARQFQGPQGAVNRRDAKRLVLNGLIKETIARQHAAKLGITVGEAEISREVRALQRRFPNEEAFRDALRAQNFSPSDLRIYLSNQMLYREIAAHLTKDQQPSQEQLRQFYEQNRIGSYDTQVRIAHILVCAGSDRSTGLCEPTENDRTLAAEIVNRARSGTDFAALAKQFSKDPRTSDKGGDLGYLNPEVGNLPVEFENAAFGLAEVGQISEPVTTPLGIHVIKLLAKGKSFEEARPEILRTFREEAGQKAYSGWLGRNVAAARVKVNPKFGRYDRVTQTVVPLEIQVPPTSRSRQGDAAGQVPRPTQEPEQPPPAQQEPPPPAPLPAP